MHFEGTVAIAAPRDKVWAFVTDPNQVGQCGPGVESIDVVDDTHFKATAKVGIGFISAKFKVDMEFAKLTPPDEALIKAHGQAPGSAVDADAKMRLSDGPNGGTVMDWSTTMAWKSASDTSTTTPDTPGEAAGPAGPPVGAGFFARPARSTAP